MTKNLTNSTTIFNTSLEVGLRALIILSTAIEGKFSLQRLIYFDYFLIHSQDIGVEEAPLSLHPNTPHRIGEIIVRRGAMQEGLSLMYSKSLIEIIYDDQGISYAATELSYPFLNLFETEYYSLLKENAQWITKYFAGHSDEELGQFVNTNVKKWGGEFMYEPNLKEGDL